MSWLALKWARKQSVGSAPGKSVLVILAIRTNDDGYCWPSQETIAEEAELSVDTVQRALKHIVPRFAERIKRKSADGRRISDVYRLKVESEAVTAASSVPCGMDRSGEAKSSNRAARVSSAKPQTSHQPPGVTRSKYTKNTNDDSCALSDTAGGRRLKAKVGDQVFQSWFSDVRFVGQQGETLEFNASTRFIASRIETWYQPDIIECFRVDHEGAVQAKVLVRGSPDKS